MATTTSARLPLAAWVVAAVFTEMVLAAAVVQPRFLPFLGLAAATVAAAALFRFPYAATVVVLLLVASFLSTRLFEPGAGGLTLHGWEAVLMGLSAVALLRPRASWWGGAAGGFAWLFAALLLISTTLGLAGGADPREVMTWGRGFVAIALFFVVVRLFADSRDRARLLAAAAAIGAVTGGMAVFVAAGVSLPFMTSEFFDTYVSERSGGLSRVRLPGIALAYGLILYAAVRTMRTRGWARTGWALAVLGCGMNLVLSQNRNMWAGVIVGLAALLLLGGGGLRRPLVAMAAVAFSAIAVVTLVGVEVGRAPSVAPFLERGEVLLDPRQAARDPSLRSRFDESAIAWRVAQDNLLVGIGPGVRFGVFYSEKVSSSRYERAPQYYLHNQYLYLLLIGGIPLLAAFVLWIGASVRAAWPRRRDPETGALIVGVLMLMFSGLVMISFADSNMLAALTLLAGALVAGRAQPTEPDPG